MKIKNKNIQSFYFNYTFKMFIFLVFKEVKEEHLKNNL